MGAGAGAGGGGGACETTTDDTGTRRSGEGSRGGEGDDSERREWSEEESLPDDDDDDESEEEEEEEEEEDSSRVRGDTIVSLDACVCPAFVNLVAVCVAVPLPPFASWHILRCAIISRPCLHVGNPRGHSLDAKHCWACSRWKRVEAASLLWEINLWREGCCWLGDAGEGGKTDEGGAKAGDTWELRGGEILMVGRGGSKALAFS